MKYDAERDLRDIGAKNIQVHSLNKVRLSDRSSKSAYLIMSSVWLNYAFLFSVQIWQNLLETQWKCEERCDIRHLLLLDRREPIRREVQDQISTASSLVWRGL